MTPVKVVQQTSIFYLQLLYHNGVSNSLVYASQAHPLLEQK